MADGRPWGLVAVRRHGVWEARAMSTYEYTTSVITHGFLGPAQDYDRVSGSAPISR